MSEFEPAISPAFKLEVLRQLSAAGRFRNDAVPSGFRQCLLALRDLGAVVFVDNPIAAVWTLSPGGAEVLERAEMAALEAAVDEVAYRLSAPLRPVG